MIALALAAKAVIVLISASVFLWTLVKFRQDPGGTLRFLGFCPDLLAKHFSFGIALAFAAMLFVALANWIFDAVEYTNYRPIDLLLVRALVLIVVVSLVEEIAFRAFCLSGVKAGTKSDSLSILIMSVLFGAYHASNPDASSLSILGNGAGGAMYACAFLWSRSVWLPAGLHIGWNVFQGPLWGFPVSGLDFGSVLVQQHRADVPIEILSGGDYGPEASVLGLAMRFLIIFVIWKALKPSAGSRLRTLPSETATNPTPHPKAGAVTAQKVGAAP